MSKPKKTLTPKMVREYIDSEGNRCPFCKSDTIEADYIEADGPSAWGHVICLTCNATWRDVYFLGACETLDRHGNYRDTIRPTPEATAEPS